mgnify:CR=1 FL=1|tara:strand:- start:693 stop:1958 length:1266 start_codon:yes stop_codon:yes gene_type:complete
MNTVIKIENLYKEYRLGSIGYATLREDLQRVLAEIQGKPDPNSIIGIRGENKSKDRLLALNNINLEIKEGERLAIIGSNGAGKSTLLKLISRISAPTKGLIKIKGKISSLISVGTGFHSELTGRENIYLNGSILGLRKYEIEERLSKIIEFSGVDNFLDTPVKRYSSGMVIRLGFSVAAHLDPDILITDEVLAVADLDFREKSIKKLMQISDSGKTIIFVSHNLNSVRRLCKTAILLDKGRLLLKDNVDNVMSEYISLNKKRLPLLNNIKKDQDISPIEVIDSKIIGSKRSTKDVFPVNEKIGINFVFKVNDLSSDTYIKIQLFSSSQVHVLDSLDTKGLVFNQIGTCQRTVWINKNTLNEDNYYVCLHLISSPFENLKTHLIIDNIISFETAFYQNKNSVKGNFKDKWGGVVAPKLIWTD